MKALLNVGNVSGRARFLSGRLFFGFPLDNALFWKTVSCTDLTKRGVGATDVFPPFPSGKWLAVFPLVDKTGGFPALAFFRLFC